MAAGLMQKLEFEKTTKKLYDGDYLVMVTDGVLDAFGDEPGEEIFKRDDIAGAGTDAERTGTASAGKNIAVCGLSAKDDMTVLVAGIWRK